MKQPLFLAVDVHYDNAGSTSAGVAFESWTSAQPLQTFLKRRAGVEDYQPGQFHRRELPCLLDLLQDIDLPIGCIVIDGYVHLDGVARPGLGRHLFDALGGRVRVVGVAKTAFRGIPEDCEVQRAGSNRPLYVTCAGEAPEQARAGVQSMHGPHRIPTLLKLADQLCRGLATAPQAAFPHPAGL